MDYLLFRLYGPLSSWGEIAVGETRNTAGYPGKSAIIGLIAAALGIKRTNAEKQKQMQEGYALAVEVYSSGNLLRDYHTTQVPNSKGRFSYRTRRDELVIGKLQLGTILSTREYRTDALFVVAVKALPAAPFSLNTIKKHLLEPKFHLYLGRKSCPLAAPLHPVIYDNKKNFYDSFIAYEHKPLLPTNIECKAKVFPRDLYWLGLTSDRQYYWEGDVDDFSDSIDLNQVQTRTRHDQPLSRRRWQFTQKQEHYLYLSGAD